MSNSSSTCILEPGSLIELETKHSFLFDFIQINEEIVLTDFSL